MQMIGIVLKSSKAADYINQIMGLEAEAQEFLGAIVQQCLGSICEDGTGRSSNTSMDRGGGGALDFNSSAGNNSGIENHLK